MSSYTRSRNCPCLRCRTRGLMGGAILITLGVLFLLQEYDVVSFSDSWPVLLIVIGLFIFARRTASTHSHLQSGCPENQPVAAAQNQSWQSGTAGGQTDLSREVKS